MAHLPEIGARNRHQKSLPVSDASVMQFGAKFFRYQFPVTNRTTLYFRAGLWYQFSGIRVFGADFWYVCHGHNNLISAHINGSRSTTHDDETILGALADG